MPGRRASHQGVGDVAPFRRLLKGLIVVLAASAIAASVNPVRAQAAHWPTTEFTVVLHDHRQTAVDSAIAALGNQTGLYEEALQPHIVQIETYLHEVALEYQAMGFKAPALPISARRYEVNLYPFEEGFDAPARVARANPTHLEVDVDAVINWGKWDKRLYEHLAHELFHAVQAAYDHNDDDLGGFFNEGTAQAVGVDMAYRLRGEEPSRSGSGRWAARRYDVSLLKPVDRNDTYATASFWRYLGEEVTASAKQQNASIHEIPANYRYLHEMMLEPLNSGSDKAVLQWLNSGLLKSIKQPLDREYAFFLSTFAGYGEGRYTSEKNTPQKIKAIMQDKLFNKCTELPLEGPQSGVAIPLKIDALAGKCIRIADGDASRPGPVQMVIQVEADSARELNQLWMGAAGAQKTSRRLQASGMTEMGRHFALWQVDLLPDEQMSLIVTNMDAAPWETKSFTGQLSITTTAAKVDSTFVGPLPAAPARGATKTGTSRNKQAARELTFNGSEATKVVIDADNRAVRISIRATPDILNVLAGVNAEGGAMEQILTAGEILNETLGDMNGTFFSLSALEKSTPGTAIDIAVPFFDYGFTGTIPGARISTNGYDGGEFHAVGPTDSLPGGQREFRPSGTVTIIHYSPTLLEGRFVADFTDPDSLTPKQMQESQPTLDIIGNLQGYFRIAAPWKEDSRYEPDESVTPLSDLRSDIMARMPQGQEDIVDAVMAAAEAARQTGDAPDMSAIAASQGAPRAACDCSCSGMRKLEAMGEAVDQASRAPTPAELAMAKCGLTCMAEYQRCE